MCPAADPRGGLLGAIKEFFRSEELGYAEPEGPRQAQSWLGWLLSSEPLEDLPPLQARRPSFLRWLFASESLDRQPGGGRRASGSDQHLPDEPGSQGEDR